MASLAGSFLVARPVLKDPTFGKTVVLLLQHGDEGAFGLVVNRRAKVKDLPFTVFGGGPCKSQGLFMLHGHPEWVSDNPDQPVKEVAPGIYLGDPSVFEQANQEEEDGDQRCRMFAGYAGWGPGQLESELAAGAWAVVPASGAALFDTPLDSLWVSLLPPAIPQPSIN
jgi:putative transcriptional regulator